MLRLIIVSTSVVACLVACGNKSKDESKETANKPVPDATSGAATPKQVMVELKEGVAKADFKRALRVVRKHEQAVFVGVAYLDVAMPVILKLRPGQDLAAGYEAINRKHNLVIDDEQLTKVAQGRKFSELTAYFDRVFKGNDLTALWRDVTAAMPKSRVIWPQIQMDKVTIDGDRAKVRLFLKGMDSSAMFDVVRERGRWYLDVGAFGKNQEPPRPPK